MASYSITPNMGKRVRSAGVTPRGAAENFETKLVNFEGHRIEVAMPKGVLADYMFQFARAARA